MNKKKCLITGGSGLLGSFLVPQLENWEIVLISKPTSDLAEEDFVRCLPKKADAIIHLAQSNHFKEFPQ